MSIESKLTLLEPEMGPVLEAWGLASCEDYVRCDLGEVVASTSTSETRRIDLGQAGGRERVYLKSYRYAGQRWRPGFLGDKGRTEARNYVILRRECGVNVPDVIAHGCRRRGWRLLDCFILTRGVPAARPLDQYVIDRWPDGALSSGDAGRSRLLEETAGLVSRMHAAGFVHVDLQWRNLLVVENGGIGPTIYVIDSARGGLRGWVLYQLHGRLRDLSSLYKLGRVLLTRREQIRWLRRYLGVRRLSACEHHALAWTILHDRGIKDNGTI